jgi:hypothetical protein
MVVSLFGSAATGTTLPSPDAVPGAVAPAGRVDAFEGAMSRQLQAADPAGAAERVAAPAQTAELAPNDRARMGLGLGPAAPAAPGGEGDMILQGFGKLRGIFDERTARVTDVMNRGATDARTMMEMQVEIVNFTLLVDMSSKLTGKTTAVFDTLMKGQ